MHRHSRLRVPDGSVMMAARTDARAGSVSKKTVLLGVIPFISNAIL